MPKKLTVDPFFTGKEMSQRGRRLRQSDKKDALGYPTANPPSARETYIIAQAKLKMLAKPGTPESKKYPVTPLVKSWGRLGRAGLLGGFDRTVTRKQAIEAAQKHAQAAAKRMEKEKKKDKTKNNPKREYIEG